MIIIKKSKRLFLITMALMLGLSIGPNMVNALVVGGTVVGPTKPEKPPKVSVESCSTNDNSGYTSWSFVEGSKSFGTPSISQTGTVYDRALTSSDFSATQPYSYQEKRQYITRISYSSPSDTETTSYYCNKDSVYSEGSWDYATRNSSMSASSISVSSQSDFKKSNGVWSFGATARFSEGGKTASMTGYSYWVVSANFSPSLGKNAPEYTLSGNSGYSKNQQSVTCSKTYGNGATFNCSMTNGTNSSQSAAYLKSNAQTEINGANYMNSGLTTLLGSNRISAANKTAIKSRANNSSYDNNSFGSVTSDGASIINSIQVRNGYSYAAYSPKSQYFVYAAFSYVDPFTEKKTYYGSFIWRQAMVDVEDETKAVSGVTGPKEVYSYDKYDLDDVTCKIYFYGPIGTQNCLNRVDYKGNNNGAKEGTNNLIEHLKGNTTKGSGKRVVNYSITIPSSNAYSSNSYNSVDTDSRTVLYVQKVAMKNTKPVIKVLETYERGLFTKKTYVQQNGNYKTNQSIFPNSTTSGLVWNIPSKGFGGVYTQPVGITWNGLEEEYDSSVRPTCEKTFATSSTGHVETRNCTSRIHTTFNVDDEAAIIKNNKTNFDFNYGKSKRVAAYQYVENGYSAREKVQFNYVTDVKINFSSNVTYQDEPFPIYTCTKTFGETGEEVSCLDKMFIVTDTRQSKEMGKMRKITYNYVNNKPKTVKGIKKPFEYLATETRVYASSVKIYDKNLGLKNETKGKTGYRQEYRAVVTWQDGTTKEVTESPWVWSSFSGKERVDYIGENWADGYVDAKGEEHKPNKINELYITDPKSKEYTVKASYPDTQNQSSASISKANDMPYYNNLTMNWSLIADKYAPASATVKFNVIGLKSVKLVDDTDGFHAADTNTDGTAQTSKKIVTATPSKKGPLGNEFANKTYQTGQWYNFYALVTWDDGTTQRVYSSDDLEEASFSYQAQDTGYVTKYETKKIERDETNKTLGWGVVFTNGDGSDFSDFGFQVLGGLFGSYQAPDYGFFVKEQDYVGWLLRKNVESGNNERIKFPYFHPGEPSYPGNMNEKGYRIISKNEHTAKYAAVLNRQVRTWTVGAKNAWRYDNKGYFDNSKQETSVAGVLSNQMPYSGQQFRVPQDGWNGIRFELFSETNTAKPLEQKNEIKDVTFTEASLWAHSLVGMTITSENGTAPVLKADWGSTQHYKTFLIFTDSNATNYQLPIYDAAGNVTGYQKQGTVRNPWGQENPLDVTNTSYTKWDLSTGELTRGNPIKTLLNGDLGQGNHRTLKTSWGDEFNAFLYNGKLDYHKQFINILVGKEGGNGEFDGNTAPGCSAEVVSNNCDIPVNNKNHSNFRIPSDSDVANDTTRYTGHDLIFWVTGVSKGSGN